MNLQAQAKQLGLPSSGSKPELSTMLARTSLLPDAVLDSIERDLSTSGYHTPTPLCIINTSKVSICIIDIGTNSNQGRIGSVAEYRNLFFHLLKLALWIHLRCIAKQMIVLFLILYLLSLSSLVQTKQDLEVDSKKRPWIILLWLELSLKIQLSSIELSQFFIGNKLNWEELYEIRHVILFNKLCE